MLWRRAQPDPSAAAPPVRSSGAGARPARTTWRAWCGRCEYARDDDGGRPPSVLLIDGYGVPDAGGADIPVNFRAGAAAVAA
ncbi:hypothetical protein [Actinoplanes teichomyceticus]|uniref:Uncharacterized protein n=1 Tax=Actinoplanes teichomyceticus TaxID=1867 RepID=A0A561W9Z0_ACTTI|nr:hypothetical protein [Actinoplanes teichomyceticus]TWG20676.1 hypothetical protein FHX34_103205 [Actinoplanes teichomyceticus]GIF14330.1 hypothetical protein Ate01nite_43620 [Actinoplanes teichomyceticus]